MLSTVQVQLELALRTFKLCAGCGLGVIEKMFNKDIREREETLMLAVQENTCGR
jgi:hypothetical protein